MNAIAPLAALSLALTCQDPDSAPRYHDSAGLEAALRAAAAKDPGRVKLDSIGTSLGGAPIWCATLSEGDASGKAALLVVAGANGTHLVGTEMALAFVEQIAARAATDTGVAELLREHALYIVPRVNPDAAALFAKPAMERASNARSVDDDRDRRLDEDGPDDVDGDGVITSMRIPDPTGDYLIDVKDPRIVRRADRAKGERGTHKLSVEGLDNDGDGQWNEDGAGGVRIDRNFPHAWKEHDRATGTSAISEPESRALADFVLAHPNIAGMVVFGMHDNVRKAPRGEAGGGEDAPSSPGPGGVPGGGRGRGGPGGGGMTGGGGAAAPTAILRDDVALYERVVKLYKEKTALEGDVEDPGSDGAIHAWGYFQRGLPSFAVRVWTPTVDKSKDAAASGPASGPASRPAGEGRGRGPRPPRDAEGQGVDTRAAESRPREDEDRAKAERAKLEWNDKVLGGAGFVAWKAAEAAPLKEKGAEIGGWKPGVLVNPPPSELAELARKHVEFLLALTPELFPKVVLADAKLTQNGDGLATLKASIRNDGKAAALTAMARRAGAVKGVRVKLKVDGGEIVVGRPQYLVNDLDPQDPPREWTWIVKGPPGSKVVLEVHHQFCPDVRFTGEIR